MSDKLTEGECSEAWTKTIPDQYKDCLGPAGINKSMAYVAGVNVTLGMIVAAGIGFYFGKKKAGGGGGGA